MAKKSKYRLQRYSVRAHRLNWDNLYYEDLITRKGFQITEPATVSLDGSKMKSLYGPDSPLYGTNYEDEHAFIERYRCKCGAFTSRQFEGETCPICGTVIEYRDVDMSMTGWVNLDSYKIINPLYYRLLQSAIGGEIFPDIINAKYRVTTDGQKEALNLEEDNIVTPLSPYSGIGIEAFYDDYEEILGYFKITRKNNAAKIDKLLREKGNVFTSHIPIYSTKLRPQSITQDTFYYGSLDKNINVLFSLSENLKNAQDIEKDVIISRIQTKVNNMWDINFNLLSGKEGFIRNKIMGGNLNFTSRNVIIPDPTLGDAEIDLSYQTFRNLHKNKIIYYLMKVEDITLSKALSIWEKSYIFDQKVYDIMEYIRKKEDPRVLINRNPTLNYCSMLLMRIRKIKPDDSDYCLSVPLSILPGLNADWMPKSGSERVVTCVEKLCERLTSGVSLIAC